MKLLKCFFIIFILGIKLNSQPHIWKEILTNSNDGYISNLYFGSVLDSSNIIVPYIKDKDKGTYKFVSGVLRTSDGGFTWESILENYIIPNTKFTVIIEQSEYVSKNDIYVACNLNYILYTNDGGKNWFNTQLPTYTKNKIDKVSLISMYDKNFGIALSDTQYYNRNTHLYSTSDGWKTYKEVNIPNGYFVAQAATSFYQGYIKCLNKNHFVCKILDKNNTKIEYLAITVNGGETWKIIDDPVNSSIPKDSINGRTYKFNDSLNGWCLGHIYPKDVFKESTQGYLSKTTDGGNSWQFVEHIVMPIDPDTINHTRNNYYMDYFKNSNTFMLATPFSSRRDMLGNWIIDTTLETEYFRKFYYKSNYNITPIYMGVNENKIYKDFGEYTPTNIIEYGRAINVSITPNPVHNRAIIQIEKDKGDGYVIIYNMLGKQIKRLDFINEGTISLDLSGLPVGCYNALIKTKGGNTVKKIIVE